MGEPKARAEVLSTLVRHLAELPAPSTLTMRVDGLDALYGRAVTLLLTTSRQRAQQAAREAEGGGGLVWLTPLEFEPLAVALADGRVTRVEAHHAIATKAKAAREGREYRLGRERLLGPVRHPDGGGGAWTVAELLEALGGELVSVEVHGG